MEVKPNLANIDLGEVLGVGAALAEPKTLGGTPYAVIPAGFKLEDLSKFLPAPARAKGELRLADVDGFIRYVNKHKDAAGDASHAAAGASGNADKKVDPDDMQTVILVDADKSKLRAIFNHHASDAPGWGDHVAAYDCPLTREWKTWTGNNGRKFQQEEFAFFVEQNALDIHEPVGATMLQVVTTLKSTKNVQFDSGVRLADGQVQLKYHEEAKASAGESGQLTIPEKIILGIPVYQGGQAYAVTALFRYRIDGSRLVMWYDLLQPEKILEDALGKVIQQVQEGTGIQPYAAIL